MSRHIGTFRFLLIIVLLAGMILLYELIPQEQQTPLALQPTPIGVTVVVPPITTPLSSHFAELIEAQSRWRENRINDYHIKVLFPFMPNIEGSGGCIQESNVRTLDSVIYVEEIQNNCIETEELVDIRTLCIKINEAGEEQFIPCSDKLRPPPTIENLFGLIESATHQAATKCGPNGCECDGTLVVKANYDWIHGNPSRIWLDYGGPLPPNYQPKVIHAPDGVIRCTLLGTTLYAQFEAFLTPLH